MSALIRDKFRELLETDAISHAELETNADFQAHDMILDELMAGDIAVCYRPIEKMLGFVITPQGSKKAHEDAKK